MHYFKTVPSVKPSRLFRVDSTGTIQHLTAFSMWYNVLYPKMFNHFKANGLLVQIEEYQAAEYVYNHTKYLRD